MSMTPAAQPIQLPANSGLSRPESGQRKAMMRARCAWRFLEQRTGGQVSRATFYRWIGSGILRSVRLGHRIFIPRDVLDALVQRCLDGEHFTTHR